MFVQAASIVRLKAWQSQQACVGKVCDKGGTVLDFEVILNLKLKHLIDNHIHTCYVSNTLKKMENTNASAEETSPHTIS